MRLDRLTLKAQEALQEAQALAQRQSHQRLEPEHLLLALLDQAEGMVGQVLHKVGTPLPRLRAGLEEWLHRVPSVSGGSSLYASDRLNRLLLAADEEAKRLTDEYTSTEHLLLASFSDEELAQLYTRLGLRRESVEVALQSLRGAHRVTDASPEEDRKSVV